MKTEEEKLMKEYNTEKKNLTENDRLISKDEQEISDQHEEIKTLKDKIAKHKNERVTSRNFVSEWH